MSIPLTGKDFGRIPQREFSILETGHYHVARETCIYVLLKLGHVE
jgi:hypothetical protein